MSATSPVATPVGAAVARSRRMSTAPGGTAPPRCSRWYVPPNSLGTSRRPPRCSASTPTAGDALTPIEQEALPDGRSRRGARSYRLAGAGRGLCAQPGDPHPAAVRGQRRHRPDGSGAAPAAARGTTGRRASCATGPRPRCCACAMRMTICSPVRISHPTSSPHCSRRCPTSSSRVRAGSSPGLQILHRLVQRRHLDDLQPARRRAAHVGAVVGGREEHRGAACRARRSSSAGCPRSAPTLPSAVIVPVPAMNLPSVRSVLPTLSMIPRANIRPADGPPISLPSPSSTVYGVRHAVAGGTEIPSEPPLPPLGGGPSVTCSVTCLPARVTTTGTVVPGLFGLEDRLQLRVGVRRRARHADDRVTRPQLAQRRRLVGECRARRSHADSRVRTRRPGPRCPATTEKSAVFCWSTCCSDSPGGYTDDRGTTDRSLCNQALSASKTVSFWLRSTPTVVRFRLPARFWFGDAVDDDDRSPRAAAVRVGAERVAGRSGREDHVRHRQGEREDQQDEEQHAGHDQGAHPAAERADDPRGRIACDRSGNRSVGEADSSGSLARSLTGAEPNRTVCATRPDRGRRCAPAARARRGTAGARAWRPSS